jgi:hypothetical protein
VDANFERLKRYNIAEIFEPTPKEANTTTKTDEDRAAAAGEIAESAEAPMVASTAGSEE